MEYKIIHYEIGIKPCDGKLYYTKYAICQQGKEKYLKEIISQEELEKTVEDNTFTQSNLLIKSQNLP